MLTICGGRRSGRLAGHELLGAVLPIINELVSAKEQHGTDGRLLEPSSLSDLGVQNLRKLLCCQHLK